MAALSRPTKEEERRQAKERQAGGSLVLQEGAAEGEDSTSDATPTAPLLFSLVKPSTQ